MLDAFVDVPGLQYMRDFIRREVSYEEGVSAVARGLIPFIPYELSEEVRAIPSSGELHTMLFPLQTRERLKFYLSSDFKDPVRWDIEIFRGPLRVAVHKEVQNIPPPAHADRFAREQDFTPYKKSRVFHVDF